MSEDLVALANNNYNGVYWFASLSEWSGLSLDQVNFILTQIVSLSIAPIFRTLLHPARVDSTTRHGLGLGLGIIFGYMCFGYQAIHLVTLPALTYTIMCFQSPHTMQRSVIAVSLLYLSSIHLHRQFYFPNSYTLDISGPLMIIVQKITSLALNLHDGLTKSDEEMSENQKYHAIDRLPTLFEYFSYIFHHQTLMAGPLIFYKDYISFIEGTYLLDAIQPAKSTTANGNAGTHSETINNNSPSYRHMVEPSPYKAVFSKVFVGVTCAVIYLKLSNIYPLDRIREDEFVLETSVAHKLWYLNIVTTLTRFKYYYAWVLGDAVCNNSGLGFNGYTADGSPRWDKVSNINIIQFEFAKSLRDGINGWNMQTNQWLRMVVYDRVTVYPTLLTYTLSAVWHGFYGGYYITFMSATIFTMASRTIRRYFRHYFQKSRAMQIFYDILTILTTRALFGYLTFSFVILDFWPSIRLLKHMYFFFHIVSLLVIIAVPRIMAKVKRENVVEERKSTNKIASSTTHTGSVASNGSAIKSLSNHID